MNRTLTPSQFAMWLGDELKRSGLKQGELAKRLGVDPSQITRWKNGERSVTQQIRKDLAKHLGRQLDEVPIVSELSKVDPVRVNAVADGIPDHALILLAEELGLFRELGVELTIIGKDERPDLPNQFPERVERLISTDAGLPALVSAPKALITQRPGAIFTNIRCTNDYRGYPLITTAGKNLPQAFDVDDQDEQLSFLLDLLEIIHQKLCDKHGKIERVAFISKIESKFFDTLHEIYCVLEGLPAVLDNIPKATPTPPVYRGKYGLKRLDEAGWDGADIIVGDGYQLSLALCDKKYKTLATMADIRRCLLATDVRMPSRELRQLRRSDTGTDEEIVARFKETYKKALDNLIRPVYWVLVTKERPDTGLVKRLEMAAIGVVEFVNSRNDDAMRRLCRIVSEHHGGSSPKPTELAAFKRAWTICYDMKEADAGG